MDEGAKALAECLQSWRRGPYPKSTSYVSALSPGNDNEDPRWISDVHNIIDLESAMSTLTYRQREVLYRYVIMGERQEVIGRYAGISQQAVSIELETICKELVSALSTKMYDSLVKKT